MQMKNSDILGVWLTVREWIRLNKCTSEWDNQMVAGAALLGVTWCTVRRSYTRREHETYDPDYVTIEYLPVGSIVRPSCAIDPKEWLWAKTRIPGATHARYSWMHPGILDISKGSFFHQGFKCSHCTE